MSPRQSQSLLKVLLKNLEKRLENEPDSIELRLQRARLLVDAGHVKEAEVAYAEILQQAGDQSMVMDHLGDRLHAKGFHVEALKIYADLVERYPDDFNGHLHYGNCLHEAGDLAQARLHYEWAIRLDPDHNEAHRGLALVLKDLGEETQAHEHLALAFKKCPVLQQNYRGKGEPVRVLMIGAPDGGNFTVYDLLDDHIFQTLEIMVGFYDVRTPLPPHHIVLNVVGEADRSDQSLEDALKLLEHTQAPVINHPNIIRPTGRVENARQLGKIPGVVTPKIFILPEKKIPEEKVCQMLDKEGIRFPLLLRSLGFHMGKYFIRVENMEELMTKLSELPGNNIAAIQYLDVTSPDGKIRKYRTMMVDGNLYPLHLAVSHHWKVHYFSADMADSPDHRAEDQAFLENMPQVLGPQVLAVLEQIRSTLKLDYGGIDFSLGANGEVIVFEANATMSVIFPKDEEKWAYRKAPVRRVVEAFQQMLIRKAKSPSEKI